MSEWPLRYLVAECTTRSAPCSSGRCRIGEAKVLSTTTRMESFDQCLFRLYKEGKVEREEALRAADSRDGLALKFRLSEGSSGEHDPYADVFETH